MNIASTVTRAIPSTTRILETDMHRRQPASAGTFLHALVTGVLASALVLAGPRLAWADPPVSALPRLPVCGDQDAGTVQLKCPDFVPIPDIEVFRSEEHTSELQSLRHL